MPVICRRRTRIIILGTILAPLAESVGMQPVHFAIIGVISISFGLVTPPTACVC